MSTYKKTYIHTEKVLGKKLPPKAVMHHFDGNKTNDQSNNLVICENQEYHFLLHIRKRALEACGNTHWLSCRICKKHDNPQNLTVLKKNQYHKLCATKYQKKRRRGL